ncbi:flagellar biosynthesis regulator FlaF [Halovulum sp. GXIMD14793]
MNASALAQNAYSGATRIAPTSLDTEYRAFAEITRDLAAYAGSNAPDFPRLAAALHRNQLLWGILADDVTLGSNPLPEKVRAQIVYLAEFTMLHSRRVLAGDGQVDALVDINTAVMTGLRAGGGAR